MTDSQRAGAPDVDAPMPQHIADVVQRYAQLLCEGDVDGIVALFAADAVVRDPITAPEHSGHEAIRSWFEESLARNGGHIEMRLDGPVRVAGRFGAAALTATAGNARATVRVDTLDIMEFDAAGRVRRLDAYWGPTNVHLSPHDQRRPT